MLHRGELNMAKKSIKKTVEEVVKEVKAEDIPVEVVKESSEKKMIVHESGQLGYYDDDNNFVPAN